MDGGKKKISKNFLKSFQGLSILTSRWQSTVFLPACSSSKQWASTGAQDSATQRKACHMVLYQPAAPRWRHCSATREIPELLVASTTPNTFKFLGKHPKLCGTIRLRSNSSSSFSCKISRRAETPLSSFKIFQLTLTLGAGSGTKADRINFQFRFGNLNSQREAGVQPCPYT